VGFVVFGGALVGHWFHEHHWSTRGGRKRVA
jgi:membrane protein